MVSPALLRRRDEQRGVWLARLSGALGAAVGGFGTGTPIIGVMGLLFLWAKRPRRLAFGSVAGALFTLALAIGDVVVGWIGLAVANGVAAVFFAAGFVLVLSNSREPLVRHHPKVRRLAREHDVDGLVGLLDHGDPVVRAKAAEALTRFEDPRAEESLLRAITDSDFDVRQNAILALGKLRSQAAVEPLLNALGDQDSDVRLAAVVALASIGDPRAVDRLMPLAQDRDEVVRDQARDAVRRLGGAH